MKDYPFYLHVFHVSFGFFWAGALVILHFFMFPAARAAGQDTQKVLDLILGTNKLPTWMMLFGALALALGIWMMNEASDGFRPDWFKTNAGIAVTIGSISAIMAFSVGFFITRASAIKMNTLNEEIAKGNSAPGAHETVVILRNRVFLGVKIMTWLAMITVVCMTGAHFI